MSVGTMNIFHKMDIKYPENYKGLKIKLTS